MNKKTNIFFKLLIFFVLINPTIGTNIVKSAEQIKITYSIFSRTIDINALKNYSKVGKPDKKLKKLLNNVNSSNKKNLEILNKNYDLPQQKTWL